jgi:hypothetical protein
MSDDLISKDLVTVPVTPPLPDKFSIDDAYAIARDVATTLGTLTTVLRKHGLTPPQYKTLEREDFYQRALTAAREEWHSIKNTSQRATAKAAAIVEDSMLVLGSRIQNTQESLSNVAQMTKVVADIAGLGKQVVQNGPQERVTISIDFGADTKLVVEKTIEAETISAKGEGETSRVTLPPQPKGESVPAPLWVVPPEK